MKYRTLLLTILLIIVVICLFGLGVGFLSAFISDKFGGNFMWAGLIILVVLSLIYLVRDDIKSKKKLTRKRTQYIELGQLLFKNNTADFEVFFNTYMQAGNKNIRPIEALYEFADKKRLTLIIDWKGEGNDGEVINFISSQINKTISWTSTTKLRDKKTDDKSRDGKFIIQLFKTIDKDLKEINKKLLFFDFGTDSYIFTVTDTITFKEITNIENKDFHGSEKIKN